jgi:hypothetical protein
VVLLLLVAGLALLVLGLITGSTPLVVASIAASLLAACAMVRFRRRQQASGAGVSATAIAASHRSSEPAGTEPAGTFGSDDPAEREPAVADTDPPLRSRGDEPVWVIDGRPRYHLAACGFLLGRGPEPVPLRQAVVDGFSPCALCDPDSVPAAG